MAGKARIAIIGGGLMGHGIAQVFAVAGHGVAITDPSEQARAALLGRVEANLDDLGLDRSAAALIEVHETVEVACERADWVFEAAPENLGLKQELFERIEKASPRDAILASNTSVIPITQIMDRVRRKERAIGTHWWNPPYLVPLVEVVRTAAASDAAITKTVELLRGVGKIAVDVKKDVPGFVGNRLQHALWREAIALVANGVCDAKTVDDVVKASFGRRLAVLGPLENADLIGIELSKAIQSYVVPHLERSVESSPYLDWLISQGRLGFSSGEGFRTWSADEQTRLRKRVTAHLLKAATQDSRNNTSELVHGKDS